MKGALIHTSSLEAKRSLPLQSAYSASKSGVPPYYHPNLVAKAVLHVAEHPTRYPYFKGCENLNDLVRQTQH